MYKLTFSLKARPDNPISSDDELSIQLVGTSTPLGTVTPGSVGINSWLRVTERPNSWYAYEGIVFAHEANVTLRFGDAGISNSYGTFFDNVAFTYIGTPKIDIDIDSDNSGTIDRSQSEEAAEDQSPSLVIIKQSGTDPDPDIQDASQLHAAELRFFADGIDFTGYQITLTSFWVDIFSSPGIAAPESIVIGTDNIPRTIFIKASEVGTASASITAALYTPDNSFAIDDTARITIVDFDLVAHRPAMGAIGSVVHHSAEDLVGIRKNIDDDNKNGAKDWKDANVNGEDDLLLLQLFSTPFTLPTGLEYRIESDGESMQLWTDDEHGTKLLSLGQTSIVVDSIENGAMYAEWASVLGGNAALTLGLWDTLNNLRLYSDTITFTPFTSLVVAIGGNLQVPSDFPGAGSGIFELGRELQGEGYDVRMYAHGDINTSDGKGKAYSDIVSAIQSGQVDNIAMIGYSWGGGAIYDLSFILDENKRAVRTDISKTFTISLTGYIDAVAHGETFGENRRPLNSAFHVGQYTRNFVPEAAYIGGEASGGDDDVNRSYLGHTHYTIDDDAVVKGFLKTRMLQKTSK